MNQRNKNAERQYLLFTLVLLLLGISCQRNQNTKLATESRPALKDTIKSNAQEFLRIASALEPEEYLRLFANDVTWYSHGHRWTQSQIEETTRENKLILQHSRAGMASSPDIRILGQDAAIIAFQVDETMVNTTGTEYSFPHALSLVYQRVDGSWKIVHVHVSSWPKQR